MHNANVIFMAAEFMINDIPLKFVHFPFILMYGVTYVIFAWIWHYYSGIFYYFFLDYDRKDAVAWYTGLLLFMMLIFSIAFACSYVRFEQGSILPSIGILSLAWLSTRFTM